jgi:1-deoxy-D-xylulose-5-phosphate synthase
VGLLAGVRSPADLRELPADQLPALAAEIRDFLIAKVSRTGGHLGPNLGAVELTIAVHRAFNSPRDRVVWDTGHQSYVHKMLTGRQAGFERLRAKGGLSGYPSRAESEHDVSENSHASTALSYADGLAKGYALRGERDRTVVAVVGDGALTGGMCWEALNNIASAKDRSLVIVVNDNGRSYAATVGGVATHLASLRLKPGYEQVLDVVKRSLPKTPIVGAPLYEALHGAKKGLKDLIQPQVMFEDLGLKYVGPIDGHDALALEQAFKAAREFGGPVIVHCLTTKGFGYSPAEDDEADRFHAVNVINPVTGRPVDAGGATWTSVFAEEIARIGEERDDIVGITAAMLEPVGFGPFAKAHPDRVFDVGIAEQHAVTSAAGLALAGLHPVVAVYATFLNRAFDQTLLDVGLHRLPVTFVLDRAGVTGPDGPSHHGMWDLSILQLVPGMSIAVPRDAQTLREELREALAISDGPSALRFPKAKVGPDIPAIDRVGRMDVLSREGKPDVLILGFGAMAATALDVAARVRAQGIGVTVVDPRWAKPLDPELPALAAAYKLLVTIEDNGRTGGCGSAVAQQLRDAAVDVPLCDFALPQEFLEHGARDEILIQAGLSAQLLARRVIEAVARREPGLVTDVDATDRAPASEPTHND